MNRDGRSSSNDPTGEAAADPAVQLDPGRPAREPSGRQAPRRADHEEVVNRHTANPTPRRYEHPLTEDDDPVMPANDATLNTKM